VIKINAITVSEDSGDELARRFAARAGAVDGQDGFEGFELLQPTDGRTTWLVVTRWRDDAAYQAWADSPAFGHGHRAGPPAGEGGAQRPVGISSELWSFAVAGGSSGAGQADGPAGQADGPAGQAEGPAGQAEGPAGQAEGPAGQADGPAGQPTG